MKKINVVVNGEANVMTRKELLAHLQSLASWQGYFSDVNWYEDAFVVRSEIEMDPKCHDLAVGLFSDMLQNQTDPQYTSEMIKVGKPRKYEKRARGVIEVIDDEPETESVTTEEVAE